MAGDEDWRFEVIVHGVKKHSLRSMGVIEVSLKNSTRIVDNANEEDDEEWIDGWGVPSRVWYEADAAGEPEPEKRLRIPD